MATQQENQQKSARGRATQGDSTSATRGGAGSKPATPTPREPEISNEARYMMIQEAAYWRAERRGFEPGFELEDWLAAENEVDTLLGPGGKSDSQ